MSVHKVLRIVLLTCALALAGPVAAQAATFTVNTTADDATAPSGTATSCPSTCTLRDAVIAANNSPGDNTIVLPAGHYTLSLAPTGADDATTGDLNITNPAGTTTITGAGARTTTVDANKIDRVFFVAAGASAAFSHLTITGGETSPAASSHDGAGEDGAGIESFGTLSVSQATVTGNDANLAAGCGTGGTGGGIDQDSDATGPLTIDHTTIAGNSAGCFGGALDLEGPTLAADVYSISNTTMTGNMTSASGDGAGIDIDNQTSPIHFVNDTIAGNSWSSAGTATGFGGGIWLTSSNSLITANNTIVANNVPNDCSTAFSTASTTSTPNLDSDGSCFGAANGNLQANPKLGALSNNGGETDTMPLLDGSPAINAGNNSTCQSDDQRGVSRPQGPTCDLGAYEATPPFVQTTAASAVTSTSATLNGTVNPDNLATTYHFEYGLTTAYGSSTATQSAGSDYAVHPESAAISGLAPGTTYHYRIVATNAIGTSDGADMTFTTPLKPLKLSVSPHSTMAGKRVCFSFKASSGGLGVSGVKIRFKGRTAHTSSHGKARICATMSRAGVYAAHASKSGYRSVTARVTVRRKPKAKPKPTPKPTFTG